MKAKVTVDGEPVKCTIAKRDDRVTFIHFDKPLQCDSNTTIKIEYTFDDHPRQ